MHNRKEIGYNPIQYRTPVTELMDGWQFSLDGKVWRPIRVPYAPQTKLSGIGYRDFIPKCRYKKEFTCEKTDKRVILHFGAVDYETNVYVNGVHVGSHRGGYTPFFFDITDQVTDAQNLLELEVFDDYKNVPSGKQSAERETFGCFYSRTTGIWQPVWIEYVPEVHIEKFRFYPNIKDTAVRVELALAGRGEYSVEVFFEGRTVGYAKGVAGGNISVNISLLERHLWSVGQGNLYDVVLKFGGDVVHSYFGLREVAYRGFEFLLNGERIFQKLVLEQGYYADGGYTPRDLDAMQKDIDFAAELGFNGLRLHQKVFDPRYLYLCDKAGMMVWAEFPSWGIDYTNTESLPVFLAEWERAMERDFNHPCIILWCPLNEVWGGQDKTAKRDIKYIDEVYSFTKTYDSTRPCVDVSGGHHGHETDLYDFHSYEPPEVLEGYLKKLELEGELQVPLLYSEDEKELRYRDGLPVHISEFGGIALGDCDGKVAAVNECAVACKENWGYGKSALDEEEFVKRYEAYVSVIFGCRKLSGFCYTQLYDIEQECNGFRTYERKDKLSRNCIDRIRAINSAK